MKPHFFNTVLSRGALIILTAILVSGCAQYPTNNSREGRKESLQKKNIQLASQYLQANQPLKAIARLKKNLQTNPNSAESYGLLGVIYQRQEEYALSGAAFKKALRLAPGNSAIRNNYGALLYTSGKYEEAAKQFHQVSKDVYYESRDRVFENLGATYAKMGDRTTAIKHYRHALRLNVMLPGANLKLAQIYLSQGKAEEAYYFYNRFADTGKQTAGSLWTGIQIAHKMNDQRQMTNYTGQLEKYYPHSEAFKDYRQWNTKQKLQTHEQSTSK